MACVHVGFVKGRSVLGVNATGMHESQCTFNVGCDLLVTLTFGA